MAKKKTIRETEISLMKEIKLLRAKSLQLEKVAIKKFKTRIEAVEAIQGIENNALLHPAGYTAWSAGNPNNNSPLIVKSYAEFLKGHAEAIEKKIIYLGCISLHNSSIVGKKQIEERQKIRRGKK